MLYFAYGSNLDAHNWTDWCTKKGFDPASLEPIGPAWLPDHEPVFHYERRLQRGGALDVKPSRGTATPGALFAVHDWNGLRAKEGVTGGYYRPIEVTVLTADGRAHVATTYTVCDERVGSFVPPGDEYRGFVSRGLALFGHSDVQFRAVAEGAAPAATPRTLFAYGTLMRGGRTHDLIAAHLRAPERPATLQGASLVRIDWYPGLILKEGESVHGELFELFDAPAAVRELDPYEDFMGYGDATSLYRRSLVRVDTESGPTLAWTYVFLGESEGLEHIASGRWRAP
ncbi:MAG: gamma-glutamylcyclotransferase [Polyangiales bacterium]